MQTKKDLKEEIVALKKQISSLKKLAYKDHLTGLLNRRYFEESIQLLISQYLSNRSKLTPRRGFIVNSLSLVIIDIDNFKKINDKYGHLVGDEVIKHLARLIKKGTRRNDLVARLGGEELIIGLVGSGIESSIQITEKLLQTLNADEFKPSYTFSAGVSTLSSETSDYLSLYEKADKALYIAKKQGKNRVVAASH